ncbi:MAG: DUF4313 domain-containing protein [Clostridiales bacterium]|nr:DUF4313 domain-containing protein [Clostridiales bacterium]
MSKHPMIYKIGHIDCTVYLWKDRYAINGNLALQLFEIEGEDIESFTDLTVNLPGYVLEKDEAFINNDLLEENLEFISRYGLGDVTGSGQSGFVQFPKVKFKMDVLEKYITKLD